MADEAPKPPLRIGQGEAESRAIGVTHVREGDEIYINRKELRAVTHPGSSENWEIIKIVKRDNR